MPRKPIDGIFEYAGNGVVVFGRDQQQPVSRGDFVFELRGDFGNAFRSFDIPVVQRNAANRGDLDRN